MKTWSAARTIVRSTSRKRSFAKSISAPEARKRRFSGIFSTRDSPGAACSCGTIFAPWITCRRSEEHTSELQSRRDLVCRLLLEKKKKKKTKFYQNKET